MPVCARCGRENPDQSSFCNSCGAAIVELPAAATEELKVVTVLFADITGSTALGERLDPEGLKEVTGAFFAAMRVEIEAEGGTVEKFIGDAIMAAFGVPRVHEDDPARALRAALRMRARLHELNTMLTERYGVALELRMGVNTGSVMAVIDPRPGEALATGDAVNAAARLEQAAEPGQVLVAGRTAQAARHFHFGPARILEVRGNYVRTDCTLVGGDSGGPLFDLDGKVIAIHSRIGNALSDNLHVPIDTFSDTWDRLASGDSWGASFIGGRPGGPYLGFQVDPDASDCRVGDLYANSPVGAAGIRKGDVITRFDGQRIANAGELLIYLSARRAGDEVSVVVQRDGKPTTFKVTIGRRPPTTRPAQPQPQPMRPPVPPFQPPKENQ